MGLFNFFKDRNSNSGLKSPDEFFQEALTGFHELMSELGYAKTGMIFIPELVSYQEKAIQGFLMDQQFALQYRDEPMNYYAEINNSALMTGILLGYTWHYDFNSLNNSMVDDIIENLPGVYCGDILKRELKLQPDDWSALITPLILGWFDLVRPYLQADEPRMYIYKAHLAMCQVGVSMILNHLGYK